MRERGLTFKEAINHGRRLGLGSPSPTRAPRTLRLGGPRPGIDLDKATQLAAALEDDEIARKLELRK